MLKAQTHLSDLVLLMGPTPSNGQPNWVPSASEHPHVRRYLDQVGMAMLGQTGSR